MRYFWACMECILSQICCYTCIPFPKLWVYGKLRSSWNFLTEGRPKFAKIGLRLMPFSFKLVVCPLMPLKHVVCTDMRQIFKVRAQLYSPFKAMMITKVFVFVFRVMNPCWLLHHQSVELHIVSIYVQLSGLRIRLCEDCVRFVSP